MFCNRRSSSNIDIVTMLSSTTKKAYSTGDICQALNTGLSKWRARRNINSPCTSPLASIWSLSDHSTQSFKVSSKSMTSPTSLVSNGSSSSLSYKDAVDTASFIPTSILLPVALTSRESLTGPSQSGVSIVQPSVSVKAVHSVLTVGSSTYLSAGTPEKTTSLPALSRHTSSPVPTPSSAATSWASPNSCHELDVYRSPATSEVSVIQQETDIVRCPPRMYRSQSMGHVAALINVPVKEFWLSTQSLALREDLRFETTHPNLCQYSRSSSSGFMSNHSDAGHHSTHHDFYDSSSTLCDEYFAALRASLEPTKKKKKKTIFERIISLFTCCFKKNKNDD